MDGFRPPQYAPGQSPELMNDPMSLIAMMVGVPVAQSMAGPGNFIPHLEPTQNMADQYLASRYQRDMMSSLNEASESGNAAVASRLLGLRSLVTDAPVTQLNREQANTIAGIANNPIAKAIAGAAVGPERLEAVMFGARGDPSALAGSTNRMGFFRRDTMGGQRMSERSLADFSQNVYQTLYGKDANVDEMRGFMASQTGTMMEELFQRGALPQAMGDMTASERVKMLSSGQRDDKTITRLAEQFGHRDMMARDENYQQATEEERKLMLAGQLDTYKGKIKTTFEAADDFTKGDPRAKSAQEIESMEGYGTAARNVDSGRVAQVAKKYTGALDAVREIFGDSGRSGSIQELMVALDQFAAGGAVGSVNVSKVESTVRQMRVAARNAGVGVEQVMQMQNQNMAMGQALGLSPELVRGLTVQNLQMTQAMRDSNVVRGRFGEMNAAEAGQMMQTRMARGEASGVGKSMAALARAYAENPELYKGTELEAAVTAYNDPKSNNTYTFDGKTVNLAELAGRGGPQALSQIASQSGMDETTFRAFFMDKGTQEYQKEGFAFQAQRYQAARDISNRAIRGNVTSRTMTDEVRALKPAGMSAADFENQTNDLAAQLSTEIGRTIIEETGGMTQKERAEYLERKNVSMVKDIFVSRGVDERTAQSRAEEFSKAAFGDTEAKRRQAFSGMAAEANTVLDAKTGAGIVGNDQLYNKDVQENFANRRVNDANEAVRANQAEMGAETNILQRVGDTLDEMGRDPTMSGAEAARRIVAPVEVRQMRDKYAPELAAGLQAAEGMLGAPTERAQKNAETILQGIYDGRNATAVQAGVGALANQLFGTDEKNADAATVQLMQRAAGGDEKAMAQVQERVAKQNGSSAEGKEKTKQSMDMLQALRDAKNVDLFGRGYRPQTAVEKQAELAAAEQTSTPGSRVAAAVAQDEMRTVGAENVTQQQAAAQVAQQRAAGPDGGLGLAAAESAELTGVKARMEEVAGRGKAGWFSSKKTLSAEDQKQYDFLEQRKKELESGDPLGTVTQQMADIAARGKRGWFTDGLTLSKEDRKQYDALSQRRKELVSGDPIGTVTQQMAEIAAKAQPGIFSSEKQLLPKDQAQYDALNERKQQLMAMQQDAMAVAGGAGVVGGAAMLPENIAEEVAYQQLDAVITPDDAGTTSRTLNPSEIAAIQSVGGDGGPMADNTRRAQQAAVAASMAAAYGAPAIAAAEGLDAANSAKTINGVVGSAEAPMIAANAVAGSKIVQTAAPTAAAKAGAAASKLAPYAGAAKTLGKVSTVAAPVLGAVVGGLEAESANRGMAEGAILGALTGDAKTGSVVSDMIGVEKGSTTDKSLGVLGATANGAMIGAGFGAALGAFGGPLAGITATGGAIVGGAIGGISELYKWATEDPTVHAKSAAQMPDQTGQETAQQSVRAQEAVQQTVATTPQAHSRAGAGSTGGGEMNINGVLSLRGLQEAILSASGQAPLDTPDGGAPVFNGNVGGGF